MQDSYLKWYQTYNDGKGGKDVNSIRSKKCL